MYNFISHAIPLRRVLETSNVSSCATVMVCFEWKFGPRSQQSICIKPGKVLFVSLLKDLVQGLCFWIKLHAPLSTVVTWLVGDCRVMLTDGSGAPLSRSKWLTGVKVSPSRGQSLMQRQIHIIQLPAAFILDAKTSLNPLWWTLLGPVVMCL